MGTPGPVNEADAPIVIDSGTLARTQSPAPGPIGLNAPSGTPRSNQASMGAQIVALAQARVADTVGDGECFALVDQALRGAGAKSASDFGRVTPNGNYVWGKPISVAELRPGDIIQFRNYRYDRTVKTSTRIDTDFRESPHHSAIVQSVDGGGAVTVLEQNVPKGGSVQSTQLFVSSSNTTDGGTTTTIKVRGTLWFYRPQSR
jgi:hypothetical protein